MINTITTDFVEFKVYPGAYAYKAFQDKYGESFERYLAKSGLDLEAMVYFVHACHVCYGKASGMESTVGLERMMDVLTLDHITDFINQVFKGLIQEKQTPEPKKTVMGK